MDFLQDLVDSGDLDPVHMSAIETMTLKSTEITWTADGEANCQPPDHDPTGI